MSYPTEYDLLIAFVILISVALICIGILLSLRRYRHAKEANSILPIHEQNKLAPKKSNHRRLGSVIISPSSRPGSRRISKSIFLYREKQDLNDSSSCPSSPVPEIRVTLPEEVDADGKRLLSRVVVVHLDEKGGLALEPVDEPLPPYERFETLDLDSLGGLKERGTSP